MKKRGLILMFLVGVLYACTYNRVYINRQQDINEGKIFLDKFYSNISNKNYKNVDDMVSDSLKQSSGINGISKMVKFINNKVGNYKSYIIDDYYIKCTTGSYNETSYNYKLKVTYDKGTIDEIVGFKKRNESGVKMNSYHANSDLLIH